MLPGAPAAMRGHQSPGWHPGRAQSAHERHQLAPADRLVYDLRRFFTHLGFDLDDELNRGVSKRRPFAIISHPAAGEPPMTEKLLLYGGAIHLAGSAKKSQRRRQTAS